MKKVILTGKLSLNKETVTKLNDSQMIKINGGFLSIFNCHLTAISHRGCPNPADTTIL